MSVGMRSTTRTKQTTQCVVLQKGLAWAYTVRRGKGEGRGAIVGVAQRETRAIDALVDAAFNMLPHPQAETGEGMVPVAAGQQQAGAVRYGCNYTTLHVWLASPKRRHAIIDSLVVVLQINASGGTGYIGTY